MYFVFLKHSLIFGCLLAASSLLSQNLVKNPSFEEFINCPKRLGNFSGDVKHWSIPTEGSTDYFNSCSTAMGTPKNFNGTQVSDFGKGYAGLYFYAPDDYREYLQAELSKTLVKGEKYSISFYISLAERSDFAIKEFGVLFSKDKMKIQGKKVLSKKKRYQQKGNKYNFMEIGYTNFYSDTQDWILVNSQFIANGTERYMTIGNFKNNVRTRMFKTKKNAKQGAYYYIDMVLVEAIDKVSTPVVSLVNEKLSVETFELNKAHVFDNILFEFDKFTLLEAAKQEMRQLFAYLDKDDSLVIDISGHTDGVGSDAYNQILSSNRAEVVAAYLQHLGLPKERITWRGWGGEKPIAKNNTEVGRKKNRRVEFIITKVNNQ